MTCWSTAWANSAAKHQNERSQNALLEPTSPLSSRLTALSSASRAFSWPKASRNRLAFDQRPDAVDLTQPLRIDRRHLDVVMRVALDQPRGRELHDGLADRRHAQAEVLRYLALADHLARPMKPVSTALRMRSAAISRLVAYCVMDLRTLTSGTHHSHENPSLRSLAQSCSTLAVPARRNRLGCASPTQVGGSSRGPNKSRNEFHRCRN